MSEAPPEEGELEPLARYLIARSLECLRPPVDRFRHPWLAPMPLSDAARAYLEQRSGRAAVSASNARQLALPAAGDGFVTGDYSLGLFHHDACEAAIELVHHEKLREGAAGSLLNLLDCALPNGRVNRTELCQKARDDEPAKPILGQLALRVADALGDDGLRWIDQHRVLDRLLHFLSWLENHDIGMHGLLLTHSSRASGFDSDILTAQLPDRIVEGPDTNTFLVLDYRACAELARRLGRDQDARSLEARADRIVDIMRRLMWHEESGFFVGLRFVHGTGSLEGEILGARKPDGRWAPLESWICYLPLYAGIPEPQQAERMIARLLDPAAFWGPWGIRTAPKDDPFFHQAARVMLLDPTSGRRGPVSNWSGPVWVLSNYYLATALARHGHHQAARTLALRTARLLAGSLAASGALHECYDDAGTGLWPKRGTFLSWNVLALTLLRQHCGWVAPEAPAA